jgi:hypothetical protein
LERDRDGHPHAVASDGRRLLHATWREPDEAYPAGNGKTRAGFETILPCRLLADICKAGGSLPHRTCWWRKPRPTARCGLCRPTMAAPRLTS